MPVTNYDTVDGLLLGESTGSSRADYMTEALGSVVGTAGASGAPVNFYRYKPYGDTLVRDGTDPDPRFLWTGESGSRYSGAKYAGQYNRARHYGREQANWTSVDPLWPEEPAYLYVRGNPTTRIDPSGQFPLVDPSCSASITAANSGRLSRCVARICAATKDPAKLKEMRLCAARSGISLDDDCLKKLCGFKGIINCVDCPREKYDYCLKKNKNWREGCGFPPCKLATVKVPRACGANDCVPGTIDPTRVIYLCNYWWDDRFRRECDCLQNKNTCGDIAVVAMHEMLHSCGQCIKGDQDFHRDRFNRAASCILRVAGC